MQSLGITIFGKVIQRKSDMNERNIANYGKKINILFRKCCLSDIGNLKSVRPRRFFIVHV